MQRGPQPSLERLAELRIEVLETLASAKPASEAVRALDAQLAWIDQQITSSEPEA
jgi:hypothetical protein